MVQITYLLLLLRVNIFSYSQVIDITLYLQTIEKNKQIAFYSNLESYFGEEIVWRFLLRIFITKFYPSM